MKTFKQIRTKVPRAKDTKFARPHLIKTNELTLAMWLDDMYLGVKKRTSEYNADRWLEIAKKLKNKSEKQQKSITKSEIKKADALMKKLKDDHVNRQVAWGDKLNWEQVLKFLNKSYNDFAG